MAYLPPTSEPIICESWTVRPSGTGICRSFEIYDAVVTVDSVEDWSQNFAISLEDANAVTLAICSLILLAYVGGLIGRSMLQI